MVLLVEIMYFQLENYFLCISRPKKKHLVSLNARLKKKN